MSAQHQGEHTLKIGVVGSGMVGGSAAFAAVMTGAASEIVLVDVNEKLAQAQAEDILDAVPYAHPVRVSAGHYEQLKGAGVVLICCGVAQRPAKLGCNCSSATPQYSPTWCPKSSPPRLTPCWSRPPIRSI
jgi:threonine dehydrogenase-like Zn-dependent dehydrogenase